MLFSGQAKGHGGQRGHPAGHLFIHLMATCVEPDPAETLIRSHSLHLYHPIERQEQSGQALACCVVPAAGVTGVDKSTGV